MSGLVRFTVDTAALLDGPASELDAATFGVLHRLLYQAWRKDGLPADIPTALRLVGANTPALRDLVVEWFPLSADGRRRNLDQEIERERLLLACEQKASGWATGRAG